LGGEDIKDVEFGPDTVGDEVTNEILVCLYVSCIEAGGTSEEGCRLGAAAYDFSVAETIELFYFACAERSILYMRTSSTFYGVAPTVCM